MRTLLISVDGMRPDAITDNRHFKDIIQKSAYTLEARTVIPSVTLPAHLSMFHSVDPSRHGITNNTYTPMARPINGICEVLRPLLKQCAFFHGWDELRDLARPGSTNFSYFCAGRFIGREAMNNNVTNAAIEYLNEYPTDFAFLYLGYTDWAGHQFGWMSDGYMEAISNSWENIHKVLNNLPDDYSVIITADHGGHDRTHGSQMPEDMTIPIIAIGPDFKPGTVFENASIKDIPPTIVKLLGVDPDPDWEGKSLF